MKIYVVCSSLVIEKKLGCVPVWWQFLKALNELGVQLVVSPWDQDVLNTLWWETYPKITYHRLIDGSLQVMEAFLNKNQNGENWAGGKMISFHRNLTQNNFMEIFDEVLKQEHDIDAIVFFSTPMPLTKGLASRIRKKYSIPTIYFEGDLPAILPKYGSYSLKVSPYGDADISEYDAFVVTSKGVVPEIEKLGARNVTVIYYGADAGLFAPLQTDQNIDVLFQGIGTLYRQDWMSAMITEPSKQLVQHNFGLVGTGFDIDIGRAKIMLSTSFSAFRFLCAQSKINLNITRKPFAEVYASSTARIFELTSMGCCVVSNPCLGIDEWFDTKNEIRVVSNAKDAVDTYEHLLNNPEERYALGRHARERVLKDHTYQNRAKALINLTKKLK